MTIENRMGIINDFNNPKRQFRPAVEDPRLVIQTAIKNGKPGAYEVMFSLATGKPLQK